MKHIILSTLFVQKKNPVHARTNIMDDMSGYIKDWHDSMTNNKINALVLHDGLPEEFTQAFSNEYVNFQQVPPSIYNACDGRWPVYQDFIENLPENTYDFIFATDISDVIVGKNPFVTDALNAYGKKTLFCGDETTTYNHSWIRKRNEDLKEVLPTVYQHTVSNQSFKLLNPGILGGSQDIFKEYVNYMANLVKEGGHIEKTVDMHIHNYVVRTYFDGRIKHGSPVNSIFNKFQTKRKDVWYIHK